MSASLPGRSKLGFDRPGRYRVHQARSATRSSAIRIKGWLHPTKNSLSGGLQYLVRTFGVRGGVRGGAAINSPKPLKNCNLFVGDKPLGNSVGQYG